MRKAILICLSGIIGSVLTGQKIPRRTEKISAMPGIRQRLAKAIQTKQPRGFAGKQKVLSFARKLNNNGFFSDIHITTTEAQSKNWDKQGKLGPTLVTAFSQLRDIAWGLHNNLISQPCLKNRLYKAINNYCALEVSRPDVHRFLASCFTLPKLASETYFILYNELQEKNASPELIQAGKMLQKVAFQAFSKPLRKDINRPYSLNQYRNHAWWVGGNFAYRNPFLCAAACNDYKMLETVWKVCNAAISPVSFNTLKTAYWNECFTADGAAWGHGTQSYAFGYGIDGANGIVRTLKEFEGTPWAKDSLAEEKFNKLLDFAEGMTWLQYRMRPCLTVNGRHNLRAGANYDGKRIAGFIREVSALNPPQSIKERINKIKQKFNKDKSVNLSGVRYFWNNDDLVMRGKDYYVFVNMISSRSTGPESVANRHSELNYNLADGSTVLLRTGDEYDYSKGAWDFLIPPGTTNRELKTLPSTTIWGGFSSKHNFAGGIGGATGCCGFIFEKAKHKTKNPKLKTFYGVKAYKSYFMLDGIMVALGSGIRNLEYNREGNIFTNLNQTGIRTPVIYGIGTSKRDTAKVPFDKTFDMAKIKQPLWSVQDGIGYIVLPEYTNSSVVISAQKKKTNWARLDKRNEQKSNLPKTADLFSISIDHGKIPNARLGGSYAYMVMMECPSPDKVIELLNSKRIEIVANNTKIQAVWDNKLKVAQMVLFSKKAVFNHASLKVQSLSPAIVQIKKLDNGKMQISVADPKQNPRSKSITLIINGRKISIPLPGKPLCGKSATIII
jgi:hypothetical protein